MLDAACARRRGRRQRHLRLRATPTTCTIAAKHDVTVVATHIRLRAARARSGTASTTTSSPTSPQFLVERARRAEAAGLTPPQIVLDAGLDLGKTPAQSAVLLRESAVHAALGYPLLLSASNKRFLGELLGLDIDDRGPESLAAVAYGVDPRLPHRARPRRARRARVCRMVEAVARRRGRSTEQPGEQRTW